MLCNGSLSLGIFLNMSISAFWKRLKDQVWRKRVGWRNREPGKCTVAFSCTIHLTHLSARFVCGFFGRVFSLIQKSDSLLDSFTSHLVTCLGRETNTFLINFTSALNMIQYMLQGHGIKGPPLEAPKKCLIAYANWCEIRQNVLTLSKRGAAENTCVSQLKID